MAGCPLAAPHIGPELREGETGKYSNFCPIPMASRFNDGALAHIEQLLAGATGTSPPYIWHGTPAYPNSRGERRDEASLEAGHQQEETTDILNGSKKADIAKDKE